MLTHHVKYLRKMPPPVGRFLKWSLVCPRFWKSMAEARRQFKDYGDRYKYPILFVAGMPKSGTTWLEKMLSTYPGYTEALLPAASFSELKTGEGHLFDLPYQAFDTLNGGLVLTKMHCHGSEQNARVLAEAGLPYVILFRDLRDVAVSHYYYVRNTPWHGDYPALKNKPVVEGLEYFIDYRLAEFASWMRSWRENRDHGKSLMFSYEAMLEDTEEVLSSILALFELEATSGQVHDIVEKNNFRTLKKSKEGDDVFFRSGTSGGWREVFTHELKEKFKKVDSDILIEFGYEEDADW